ncbi:MAG: GIY-YIG nuclease family protein [bacterium]
MQERQYHIYILTNKRNGTLYIGVTNNLRRRIYEHKHKVVEGFTSKYGLNRLVYYEIFGDIRLAIAREKQLKGWLRIKKLALIESENPAWNDLAELF